MKAILEIELFGEDVRSMYKLYRDIADSVSPGYGSEMIGSIPPSGWVAEIVGFSKKYGYDRRFMKPKKDYSRSNSKGSRGVFAEYLLESGKIYDVKSQITWRRLQRYFCTVTDDGEIKTITANEVNAMLRAKEEQTQCRKITQA